MPCASIIESPDNVLPSFSLDDVSHPSSYLGIVSAPSVFVIMTQIAWLRVVLLLDKGVIPFIGVSLSSQGLIDHVTMKVDSACTNRNDVIQLCYEYTVSVYSLLVT